MGLDMFLVGRKANWQNPSEEDGFKVRAIEIELGYWRKHPNLHGHIVQTYAGGVDDCRQIPLEPQQLRHILNVSEGDALPHTEGFFFGASQASDKDDTKQILEAAIAWLEARAPGEWRDCYYQASW